MNKKEDCGQRFLTKQIMATNLTGVIKAINGLDKLRRIYGRILRLTEKLPKDFAYRTYTEAIICHRLSIVNQTEDVQEVEDSICCGRLEMLIKQAVAEYNLCQNMIMWRAWESPVKEPSPEQWKWPIILK